MPLGRMLENMMSKLTNEPVLPLIDMGYVKAQSARDRADQILKLLPKKSVEIGGFGRLLIRVSPKNLPKVLAAFPQIKEESTYSGTTHSWLDAESADIKHARR